MMMNRKYSPNDTFLSYNHANDDQKSTSEQRTKRANDLVNPWVRMCVIINIF